MPIPDYADDVPCESFDLHRGRVDRRWLRAGTTIIAHEGIFHLAESAFHLDGLALRTRQCLREGESHRVGQTGWVEISSEKGGRALCVARPSALRRMTQAVSSWWRQWATGSVRPL